MSQSCRDIGNIAHSKLIESSPEPTQTHPTSPDMQLRKHLILRWFGEDLWSEPTDPQHIATSTVGDSDEVKARQMHDYLPTLDWEGEEFEREMALRFVVRDLSLGLDEQQSVRSTTTSMQTSYSGANACKRTTRLCSRSPSPLSTFQLLTPLSAPTTTSILISSSPPPPVQPPRPISLLASMFRLPHKPSPSVLSLPPSHFSSSTCSSGALSDFLPSVFSQGGRKIVPKFSEALEIPHSAQSRARRHFSVPTSLAPKKRRLIVRGISMDDDRALEGVKRWANSLGVVSRVLRTADGDIWIEFQDKRVAENVCCLQAQVQIPHVGRVILDWAEGRHPG